jgi:hypothetical protein
MGDPSVYEERHRSLRCRAALALILALACANLAAPDQPTPDRPTPDRPASRFAAAGRSPPALADRAIRRALDRQAAALRTGDRQAWLRDVDPTLAGEMRRLYANLRGLRVTAWIPAPARARLAGPVWHADTRILVCFAGAACTRGRSADTLTARTTWRLARGRATLAGFSFAGGPALPSRPTPWERDTLTFAAGTRVIVAAPAGGENPARWLPAAEAAARVADRYTLADPPPARYLVFLAGRREWRTWFSARADRDVLGYALRPSQTSGFIVIDATRVRPGPHGDTVLRHEMAHIATRFGPSTPVGTWATEGIAEYVAWAGRPVPAYDRTADARRLAAAIGWTERLDLRWTGGRTLRSGYYGMAFFAMRCLSQTYGEAHMLAFFDQMAHRGRTVAQASDQAFRVPWETAQRACAPTIAAWLRDRDAPVTSGTRSGGPAPTGSPPSRPGI